MRKSMNFRAVWETGMGAVVMLLTLSCSTACGADGAADANAVSRQAADADAIHIGSRRELFVDDKLIDEMTNVRLKLHQPVPREVAIRFDLPWEGPTSAYVTVLEDGDLYRMYYRGTYDPGRTCYAESRDGIHWEKPELGLFEFNGSRENNIIWEGVESHNFAPFIDTNPDCPPKERYKALGGNAPWAFASPDGIRWRKLAEHQVISTTTHAGGIGFDSMNTAHWNAERGEYVAYLRSRYLGVRSIRRCTSEDFLHWKKLQQLDFGDTPAEQLYTNGIVPCDRAPHILIGLPMRYVSRKAVPEHPHYGISDAVFMSSRDGLTWDRRFLEAFIRPGSDELNWTDRNNMPAWGIVSTGPGELSVYWSRHYRHPSAHLQRGTLRLDGFVSVHADYEEGEFVTKPLIFAGKELVINYATSAVGHLRVELQTPDGRRIRGFEAAAVAATMPSYGLYGDEIEKVVAWGARRDVSELAGQAVRLRFLLKDADLYSFRFREVRDHVAQAGDVP